MSLQVDQFYIMSRGAAESEPSAVAVGSPQA